jgi:hypothetical protein
MAVSELKINIPAPDTKDFDKWVAQLRLLVSHVGFALDGYLLTRPSTTEEEGRDA